MAVPTKQRSIVISQRFRRRRGEGVRGRIVAVIGVGDSSGMSVLCKADHSSHELLSRISGEEGSTSLMGVASASRSGLDGAGGAIHCEAIRTANGSSASA